MMISLSLSLRFLSLFFSFSPSLSISPTGELCKQLVFKRALMVGERHEVNIMQRVRLVPSLVLLGLAASIPFQHVEAYYRKCKSFYSFILVVKCFSYAFVLFPYIWVKCRQAYGMFAEHCFFFCYPS